MDHKNLGYFKQPQKLTHCQARWSLFMQDFDIKWGVEWGINMGPANALSRKDEVDTSSDNWETILLEEEDQDHHIQPLDLALATKITSSSSLDLIISKPSLPWMMKPENPGFHELTRRIGYMSMDTFISKIDSISPKLLATTWWKAFMSPLPGDMKGSSAPSTECRKTTGG